MGKMVSQKQYELCPEGLHAALCVDVVELGMLETAFGTRDTVELRWQVFPVEVEEVEDDHGNPAGTATVPLRQKDGKPFMILNRYTASLSPKSNLYKHLVSWRGKKFTPEELKGFDLDNILGKPCQLQIVHNDTDDGRTFANIQAIVPYPKGHAKPEAEDYVRVKDRDDQPKRATVPADDSDLPF